MDTTHTCSAYGINSRSVGGDYRRADAAGRRFRLFRHTYRAGRKGARYTATEWIVSERDPATDRLIASLERKDHGASRTIAAAHFLIAAYLIQLVDGGDDVSVARGPQGEAVAS